MCEFFLKSNFSGMDKQHNEADYGIFKSVVTCQVVFFSSKLERKNFLKKCQEISPLLTKL